MNKIVQLGCLFSKLLRLFVNFLSAIVEIFTVEDINGSSFLFPVNAWGMRYTSNFSLSLKWEVLWCLLKHSNKNWCPLTENLFSSKCPTLFVGLLSKTVVIFTVYSIPLDLKIINCDIRSWFSFSCIFSSGNILLNVKSTKHWITT